MQNKITLLITPTLGQATLQTLQQCLPELEGVDPKLRAVNQHG